METKALHRLSYGLFVLTARQNGQDNGCIVNTVMQMAESPIRVGVCLTKSAHTHDMIAESGRFAVSVLSQQADFSLFERFGFQSGRTVDKFADFAAVRRGSSGLLYVTEGTNAGMEATVCGQMDLGTHTLFVGEVTDMAVLSEYPSTTYEYYLQHIKPQPTTSASANGQTVWRCRVCGYEYVGEQLPADYVCPLCKHPASDFEKAVK